MSNNVHIVQLSFDKDAFNENAPQDSRSRQVAYAKYLEKMHPGARLTNIVLKSESTFQKDVVGNLTLQPKNYYRLRHIFPLFRYLRKLHRQNPITLITTQDLHGIFWAGLAFGRFSNVPVIGQVHSNLASDYYRRVNYSEPYGRLYERIVFLLIRAFDGLRVVNTEAKKFLETRGYKKCIAVLPVQVTVFTVDKETEASKKKNNNVLRVIFVGRFVGVKNLELWLKTAHKALQSCNKIEFFLIGDGEERRNIEKLRDSLCLNEKVTFVGSQTPHQLAHWYASSDIIMLTSRYEGLPRVIVEAMNYGVVPVCTDTSCPRDLVQHGVNGYLAGAEPEALSTFLVDLASDRNKCVVMCKRARATVKEHYSPEKLRKKWMDFLLSYVT